MKNIGPAELERFLRSQTPENLAGEAVDDFLTANTLDAKQFQPFARFHPETYARNLIARNDDFELLLITWHPRDRTPIHDHGGQRCWMGVISGELTFANYDALEKRSGAVELKRQGPSETHSTSEVLYIDDTLGIHSIANASKEPAISLHLYAGPVPRCRYFCEKTKRFFWKELEYFSTPEGNAYQTVPKRGVSNG